MSTVRYDLAMHSLCAGKFYGCKDTTYEGITWNDEGSMPTREALETEWSRIQVESEKAERNMNRIVRYPSTDELLVALWEKLVETDGLTSDAIAEIQARRQAVKNEIP
ncbi:MAG: hypothetical protein CMK23_05315 [Porticoccaceae bacterium]|nr:hypothetical protein [Porticoccaceae bacterium]